MSNTSLHTAADARRRPRAPAPDADKAAILALVALVAVPPLLLGAVHVPVIAAVGAGSFALCLAAIWRGRDQPVVLSPLGLAALLSGLAALLQLVPLSEGVLGALSPQAAEGRAALAALGIPGVEAGGRISLAPSQTALAAFRGLALAAASVAAATLLAPGRQRRSLVVAIAVSLAVVGVLQVGVGLAQTFLGEPGEVLGFFKTSRASTGMASGTFINSNHGAAFGAMAAMAAVGLAASRRGLWRAAWATSAVVCAAGVLVSASRGGIAALAVAGVGLGIHLGLRGSGGDKAQPGAARPQRSGMGRWGSAAGWIGVALLPVGLALLIVTQGELAARFSWEIGTSTSIEGLGAETKVQMIRAALRMIGGFAWAGIGADAFGAVAPGWMGAGAPSARFAFVESDPIEVALAFGLPAGLTLIGLALLAWRRILSPGAGEGSRRLGRVALGVAYGLVAWALTAALSFNVEVLGLALPALVCAEGLLAERRRAALVALRPAVAAAALVAVAALAGGAMWLRGQHEADEGAMAARLADHGEVGRALVESEIGRGLSLRPLDGHALAQAALLRYVHDPAGDSATAGLAARASTLAPAHPGGHLAGARVAAREGRFEDAADAYRRAMEGLKPVPASFPRELLGALPDAALRARAVAPRRDAIRVVIQGIIAEGKPSTALEVATELQSLHPDQLAAHYWAAQAAQAAKQPLLSELFARHMIDAFPDDIGGYLALTAALWAQDRLPEALPALDAGIVRLPDEAPLRLKRVEALLALPMNAVPGRDGVIKDDLERLRAQPSADKVGRAQYFYLSGLRWEQLGRSDRAKVDFERAASLRPEIEGYRRKAARP